MFFIIWGSRGITKTNSRGVFYCPECELDRPYADKSVRRWFTLFFIPIIPLNDLGSFIECQICQSTYAHRVLRIPTTAQAQAIAEIAARRTLVGTALADGQVSRIESTCAIQLARMWRTTYTSDNFTSDISEFSHSALVESLRVFSRIANEHGKAQLLKVAMLVAYVDGDFHDAEIDIIHNIAFQLDVPASYLPGIMHDALASLHEKKRRESINGRIVMFGLTL